MPDPVIAHVIGTIALLGSALLMVAAISIAQQVSYMQAVNIMLAEVAESCARELVELVSVHTLGGSGVTYMALTLPSSLAGQPYNLSLVNRGDNVIEVRAQLQLYRQVRVVVTPNFGRGPVYAVSGTVEVGDLALSDHVLLPTPQGWRAMLVAVNQGDAVLVGFARELGPFEKVAAPSFKLVNWTAQVAGLANSSQLFVFAVWNRGGKGDVQLVVYDDGESPVNSTVIGVGAGEVVQGSMLLKLPSAAGTYAWRVVCRNLVTNGEDDAQLLLVSVKAPKMTIDSYTSGVSGKPNSQARIDVAVRNVGDASGTAVAQIQELGANCSVPVPPGEGGACSILVWLPGTPGSYTWTLSARTQETGYEEQHQVNVYVQQPEVVLSIARWNSTVVGAVGQEVKLAVLVENGGNSSIQAAVEVADSGGSVLAQGGASVPAASQVWVILTASLPSQKGTYTWYVRVYRQGQNTPDDAKPVAAEARDIALVHRTAFLYESFDPPQSGWSNKGGEWTVTSGGWDGNALWGRDDDKGPGAGKGSSARYVSVYYWQQSLWSYANSASGFGVVVKLYFGSGDSNVYRGFALLDSSLSKLYEVSAFRLGQRVQLFLRKLDGDWSFIDTSSEAICDDGWYTLYLSFSTTATASFTYELYDASGKLLAGKTSSTPAGFQPSLLALLVDEKDGLFDDLVAANGDSRYVVVSGLPQGWSAELYSSGALVASAAGDSTGTAKLLVAHYPILRGASLALKDASGKQVLSRSLDLVLGGDVYSFSP